MHDCGEVRTIIEEVLDLEIPLERQHLRSRICGDENGDQQHRQRAQRRGASHLGKPMTGNQMDALKNLLLELAAPFLPEVEVEAD